MKKYLLVLIVLLVGLSFWYWHLPARLQHTLSQSEMFRQQKAVPPPPAKVLPARIDSIPAPSGFRMVHTPGNGFGKWLQQLPLRKNNMLYLHNGQPKPNQWLHYAILNVPYNRHPLQQCADAVMRLWAEYLYASKAEPIIRFFHQQNHYFTCATTCTRPQLENFLTQVFSWCGTYNLQAQLHPVASIQQIQAGDVFVKGGSPGHAMLVAAVAQNKQGKKVFLLLQSFIPAQDIHLVKNTFNHALSPWYDADAITIATPGYTFRPTDLRRW